MLCSAGSLDVSETARLSQAPGQARARPPQQPGHQEYRREGETQKNYTIIYLYVATLKLPLKFVKKKCPLTEMNCQEPGIILQQ